MDLDSNDELYTDIAMQMLSAYLNNDKNVTNELMHSYCFWLQLRKVLA